MKSASGYLLIIITTVCFAQPSGIDGTSSDVGAFAIFGDVEFTLPERCEKPEFTGEIPDGALSSESELLALQAKVDEFIRDMDDYLACANEGLRIVGDYTTEEFEELLRAIVESARAEVDEIASAFWDQAVAFRTANDTDEPGRPAQR